MSRAALDESRHSRGEGELTEIEVRAIEKLQQAMLRIAGERRLLAA